MASSSVWDLTEASVAIIARLPLLIQTYVVIQAAQSVVSNSGNLLSFGITVTKMMVMGTNPFR